MKRIGLERKTGILKRITHEISCAEKEGILDSSIYDSSTGFSGKKIIGLLQRLTPIFEDDDTACYLEVGVFKGLTLLSTAISSPNLICFGIDNFAFFDPKKENLSYVKSRLAKYELKNVHIINSDYESAFSDLHSYIGKKKIAVYFIDGPHDYRSQILTLFLALPYLHENAVIIVDDCNYRHVRQANNDFLIINPKWKLIFEAYTHCHPDNMTDDMSYLAREGWWNGVNVLVKDSANELIPMYPPTESSRKLYENDHIIHGARFAEVVPQLLDFFQSILRLNLYKAGKSSIKLILNCARNKNDFKSRFDSMNTFSADLTKSHYARYRSL
ncbi:MAG: class I SAM-dependent methyltransferase [bacterium]